jgi:hypothetical protein
MMDCSGAVDIRSILRPDVGANTAEAGKALFVLVLVQHGVIGLAPEGLTANRALEEIGWPPAAGAIFLALVTPLVV